MPNLKLPRRDVTRQFPFVDPAGSVVGTLYDAPTSVFSSARATESAAAAAAAARRPPSPPAATERTPELLLGRAGALSAAELLRPKDLERIICAFDSFAETRGDGALKAVPLSALSAALRTLGLHWTFSAASFAEGDQSLLGGGGADGEGRRGSVEFEVFAQLCVRTMCAAWLGGARADPDGTANGAAAAAKFAQLESEYEGACAAAHRRGRSLTAAEIWAYFDPRATSLLPGGVATFRRMLRSRGVHIGTGSATLEHFVVACEIIEAVCVASPLAKRAAAKAARAPDAAGRRASPRAAKGQGGPRRVPLPASRSAAEQQSARGNRGASVAQATAASRARVKAISAAAAQAGGVAAQLRRRKGQVGAVRAARGGRLASAARRQQLRERRAWELEQSRIETVARTLRIVETTPAEAAEAAASAAATMQQQDGVVVDVDGIVAETDRLFSALMSEM